MAGAAGSLQRSGHGARPPPPPDRSVTVSYNIGTGDDTPVDGKRLYSLHNHMEFVC